MTLLIQETTSSKIQVVGVLSYVQGSEVSKSNRGFIMVSKGP